MAVVILKFEKNLRNSLKYNRFLIKFKKQLIYLINFINRNLFTKKELL